MSPRVRAVAGFKSFTDPQLVTTGRGVVKEMKDNPNFPNPPEELKTLESASQRSPKISPVRMGLPEQRWGFSESNGAPSRLKFLHSVRIK